MSASKFASVSVPVPNRAIHRKETPALIQSRQKGHELWDTVALGLILPRAQGKEQTCLCSQEGFPLAG